MKSNLYILTKATVFSIGNIFQYKYPNNAQDGKIKVALNSCIKRLRIFYEHYS